MKTCRYAIEPKQIIKEKQKSKSRKKKLAHKRTHINIYILQTKHTNKKKKMKACTFILRPHLYPAVLGLFASFSYLFVSPYNYNLYAQCG